MPPRANDVRKEEPKYATNAEVPFHHISVLLETCVSTKHGKKGYTSTEKHAILHRFLERYVNRASDDTFPVLRLICPAVSFEHVKQSSKHAQCIQPAGTRLPVMQHALAWTRAWHVQHAMPDPWGHHLPRAVHAPNKQQRMQCDCAGRAWRGSLEATSAWGRSAPWASINSSFHSCHHARQRSGAAQPQ
jgi:hypothetical protein